MIIVDAEFSGLDPNKDSLVGIGAVDFDNPENQLYIECRIWDGAHVNEDALAINGFTREQLTDPTKPTDKEAVEQFLAWAKTCKEQTLAGQNPALDRDFLKATAHRYHLDWPYAQRTVDIHSIAYFDMLRKGMQPPLLNNHSALNLDAILNYVGMPAEPKPHIALNGAKLEAEALSRLLYGRNLLPEYAQYPIPEQFLVRS